MAVSARGQRLEHLVAPSHTGCVEVAAALRRAELRGDLTAGESTELFTDVTTDSMNSVPLTLDPPMVLAERLGATLVTTDRRLARSPNLGVPAITSVT